MMLNCNVFPTFGCGRMQSINAMSREPIVITTTDPKLRSLSFKPYRSKVERRVIPFVPGPNDPQTMVVKTTWGSELTAKAGDFLVSETDTPDDYWPIDPAIFDESYVITRPGYCVKTAVTLLVPLTELTGGDPDRMVTVVSLEGPETVRAGDFFLAKGVKSEIWPYPKEKVEDVMTPVE
jgi:hypothetical protein